MLVGLVQVGSGSHFIVVAEQASKSTTGCICLARSVLAAYIINCISSMIMGGKSNNNDGIVVFYRLTVGNLSMYVPTRIPPTPFFSPLPQFAPSL